MHKVGEFKFEMTLYIGSAEERALKEFPFHSIFEQNFPS